MLFFSLCHPSYCSHGFSFRLYHSLYCILTSQKHGRWSFARMFCGILGGVLNSSVLKCKKQVAAF